MDFRLWDHENLLEIFFFKFILAIQIQIRGFYDLDLFEQFLYATDHVKFGIARMDRFIVSNRNVSHIWQGQYRHKAYVLRIFHRQRQPMSVQDSKPHPCSENNGGCQHICLIAYNRKESAKDPVAACVCAAGYKLAANGHGCESNFSFLEKI